jgi:chitinase
MAERVEGRVALGYVTYYGSATPDPTYLTHINYAFAELYMKDGVYQRFDLQGQRARFDMVKGLKQKNFNLKVMLSFTDLVENSDNARGGGFSALAKDPASRKQFAQDCLAFVRNEGIDGIDIDWEFPGMTFSSTEYDTQVDVDNYVLLMKDLRETLGSSILLTYAGYCMNVRETTDGGRRYIDAAAVAPYVDFINIMTYDMDETPRHQSALVSSKAYFDCTRSVNEYLNAGVPASKLVLGIPFYARNSFAGGGAINYGKFNTLPAGYKTDNWDADASVPYLTDASGNYAGGYDDPRSIAIKGDWLLGKGMKGMMFWDYDGDDAAGTLRHAVWNAVMKQ